MTLLGNSANRDGNVAVHLVDLGDVEIVPCNTLRDLATLSPVLARIPPQAIRVRLARVPPSPLLAFTEQAAQKLRDMVPPESRLMMRVMDIPTNGPPVVELYERLENQKIVILNASLEMDESLFRPVTSLSSAVEADLSQRMSSVTMPSFTR